MNTTSTTAAADLLQQISDIKGLHPVSAWPLAAGWWIAFAACALLTSVMLVIYFRYRQWQGSWRYDAAQSLTDLEASLTDRNSQAVSAALSECLRRIAIRKYSRVDCAGLQGDEWLQWLKLRDPKGFDWTLRGPLLNQSPYAPPGAYPPSDQLRDLIHAARKWVN